MVTAIDGRGTPESVWLAHLRDLGLPDLALDDVPSRVVVVAPHPDDEVLAVGGLLALLASAGAQVDVVAVTDGEASHPGGSLSPVELAAARVVETDRALALLGLAGRVTRLGLPDGGADELEEPVTDALALAPGQWLLGPWVCDGHPDHEAVGRACARAAVRDGARLLAFPIWAWHWATPDEPSLPWDGARQVCLPEAVRTAKAAALQAFVTQVSPLGPLPQDQPILPPHVLARFARPVEVVFT